PQRADLTQFLPPGRHTIEVRGGPSTHASAYVNASYYLPWTDSDVTTSSVRSGDAESLRYSVQFDRPTASPGDSIRCTVHADRVVFYLWPRASGTTFSFSLKARFPMTAQSSESILYDYYNPEGRASVPPARFTMK